MTKEIQLVPPYWRRGLFWRDALKATIKKHCPDLFGGGRVWEGLNHSFAFNLLCPKAPTVAVLQATDGGIEHTVCFFDDYIFDAEEETALHITPDNLNKCCGGTFQRVFEAIEFAGSGSA